MTDFVYKDEILSVNIMDTDDVLSFPDRTLKNKKTAYNLFECVNTNENAIN